MTNGNGPDRPYSDTTRAVLDLAIERLAPQFPAQVADRLKSLADARKLGDPDAVLAAFLVQTKEGEGSGDQDSDDSSGPRSST